MKLIMRTVVLFVVSLLSQYALADGGSGEKNFAIGIGGYSLILAYDDPSMGEDDEFSGGAFSLAYAFTDNVALRGIFYSMEHVDYSSIEITGLDLAILAGSGLATTGFKGYGGIGIYNETMKISGFSGEDDFSGIQLLGGLGYNWDVISVELSVALRGAQDYADFIEQFGGVGTVVAVSSALIISVRF